MTPAEHKARAANLAAMRTASPACRAIRERLERLYKELEAATV